MKKLLFFFLFPFVAIAQSNGVMDDYYNSITDWNISSAALKTELNTLISNNHVNLPYTSSNEDTWDALQISDLKPSTNDVYLIYGFDEILTDGVPKNDYTRSKTLMQSGSNDIGYWNREHMFPKSLATPALTTSNSSGGPSGNDLHNLRACDFQMNATRNNNVYGDGSGDSVLNSGVFFPGDGTGTGGDDYRGDVARAIMYMYIRYPSEINPNDVASSSNSYHDDMPDIFLEWNKLDAPSDIEKLRNNTFESKQGNRNPFIDNPYLAHLIWGGPTPAVTDWWNLAAPRITFNSASSVNETNGDVSTDISVTMSSYSAPVTIGISVDGSSTAENGDYTLNTSSLTFNSNGSQNISVTVKNDDDNHNETIILNVSLDVGSATLVNSQHTISISDDEKQLIMLKQGKGFFHIGASGHEAVEIAAAKSLKPPKDKLSKQATPNALASTFIGLSTFSLN